MAQVTSPNTSVVASPSKVELNRTQAYAILDNLSLLAYEAHKHDKLSYTTTSVTLGTNSGWWRTSTSLVRYVAGSEVTTELDSLLPLINRVHNCLTKNSTILNEYAERSLCIGKVENAVSGLEALKINQYQAQSKKQEQINKSIEVLKRAKTFITDTQAETTKSYTEIFRLRREEEEARQREKDARLARLEEDNKVLRAQVAAIKGVKDLSPEQLISLAQDCLALASSKMSAAKTGGADSLRKTST